MKRIDTVPGLIAVVLVAVLAWQASAQDSPPVLVAEVDGKPQPLKLAKVETDVRILGCLAETHATLTFANPHRRALAGELYFPLPEGATVSGYALDVKGQLVDGVVVEKPKAREVFEEITRKGVDPGLVEWVKGNSFRTRVFPIPAEGTRTIRVDYVSELTSGREGMTYYLPLRLSRPGAAGAAGDKVARFHLRVEIAQGTAEPVVREGGLANFKFQRWQKGFAAEMELTDAALDTDLHVAIPDMGRQPVLVEKGPDGTYYFCINDAPPLAPPPAPAEEGGKPETPKLVTILWDASGSRGQTDRQRERERDREIKALEQCLNCLACGQGAPTFKFTGFDVDLVIFRDKAEKPVRFKWDNMNARAPGVRYGQELLAALGRVQYDGGTQMACITPPPAAERPDVYLLFTDGISNFGKEDPEDFRRPVYVFSADAGANHPFLRYLAAKTGGEYFNLNRVETKTILERIGRPAYAFLSAEADGAAIGDVYPRIAQPVQGPVALAGKLTGDQARVRLNYGVGGKTTATTEHTIARTMAVEGNLLRRFWAQRKLDDLMALPKRNAKEITAVGQQCSIVTPGTSLLVLEGIEQYVEYRIVPPKSMPEMYAEYQRRIDTVEGQAKKERSAKIDQVVKLWSERVKWWQTEYKYPKDFRYKETKGKTRGIFDEGPADSAMLPRARGDRPAAPAQAGEPQRNGESGQAGGGRGRAPGRAITGALGLDGLAPAGKEESKDEEGDGRRAQPGVIIQAWDPKTPYLAALKSVPAPGQLFAEYMNQRARYAGSPAFYLDCAEFFQQAGQHDMAIQVLSNVAELELENAALIRVLAHKLAQWDRLDLAAMLFEEALTLRPEEPQSYRDLALVLARTGSYARAIELLMDVVLKPWDERFAEVETIALMELNRLLPKARAAGADLARLNTDPRLVKLLDVDVRIVLTWDADMTDIDLWVTEPSGEKAFYGHNQTTIGGRVSRDFTQGYGPEEYCLRKAMNGLYKIQVNYYGSSQAALQGAVTLQVDVFTNFGRPDEKLRSITRRLEMAKETIDVGEIEF